MARESERTQRLHYTADHLLLFGGDETRPDLVQGMASLCLFQLRGSSLLQAGQGGDDGGDPGGQPWDSCRCRDLHRHACGRRRGPSQSEYGHSTGNDGRVVQCTDLNSDIHAGQYWKITWNGSWRQG